MMLFKSLKRKVSKQVSIGQGGAAEYTNPIREWAIGLTVALVVFIAGATLIALDFYNQFGAPTQAVVIKTEAEKYRVKDIMYYTDEYKKREQVFNQLREIVIVEPEVPTTPSDSDEVVPEVLNGDLSDTQIAPIEGDVNTSETQSDVPLAEQ